MSLISLKFQYVRLPRILENHKASCGIIALKCLTNRPYRQVLAGINNLTGKVFIKHNKGITDRNMWEYLGNKDWIYLGMDNYTLTDVAKEFPTCIAIYKDKRQRHCTACVDGTWYGSYMPENFPVLLATEVITSRKLWEQSKKNTQTKSDKSSSRNE